MDRGGCSPPTPQAGSTSSRSPSPTHSPIAVSPPSSQHASPAGSPPLPTSTSNQQPPSSFHHHHHHLHGGRHQLVATFKLPKTCTACGKAIKTQGKVCAKCKMRKYRERKKEQEQSLKTQMKQYREQEEFYRARIRQLEEEVRRRDEGNAGRHVIKTELEYIPSVAPTNGLKVTLPMSSSEKNLLAQQQEVLRQQQEAISVQQSIIAQQQHIINQHNLGHLAPAHLQRQCQFLVDYSAFNAPTAAVAALAALGEPSSKLPPSIADIQGPHSSLLATPLPPIATVATPQPPALHSAFPPRGPRRNSLLHLTRAATQEEPLFSGSDCLLPLEEREAATTARQEHQELGQRSSGSYGQTGSAPSSPNDNRMAITHLLAPPDMCAVSCV